MVSVYVTVVSDFFWAIDTADYRSKACSVETLRLFMGINLIFLDFVYRNYFISFSCYNISVVDIQYFRKEQGGGIDTVH